MPKDGKYLLVSVKGPKIRDSRTFSSVGFSKRGSQCDKDNTDDLNMIKLAVMHCRI